MLNIIQNQDVIVPVNSLAGRCGMSAKLSPGTVRDYLLKNYFIMKDAMGIIIFLGRLSGESYD
jgi:hypothetical protein